MTAGNTLDYSCPTTYDGLSQILIKRHQPFGGNLKSKRLHVNRKTCDILERRNKIPVLVEETGKLLQKWKNSLFKFP